jgi:hypothetical protein
MNGLAASHDLGDEQMDQIRDLLFGEVRRALEGRVAALEARLGALEARVEAVARDRSQSLEGLADGIAELGQHVRRLSNP